MDKGIERYTVQNCSYYTVRSQTQDDKELGSIRQGCELYTAKN